jgi:hypothetical protein
MSADDEFAKYLAEPCDEDGCENTATHNGQSRATKRHGKFCNQHTDWDLLAFARDD